MKRMPVANTAKTCNPRGGAVFTATVDIRKANSHMMTTNTCTHKNTHARLIGIFTILLFTISLTGCALWPFKKAPVPQLSETDETAILSATDTDYRLGPDDVLMISVWKNPELTREVVVRPDGKISFPLVGEIQAGGRTVQALEEELKEKVSEYIPGVSLTVLVNQANNYKIYVIGQVPRPGEYRLGQPINVMQALSKAGGLATFAERDEIIILRTENGSQEKIPFNYKQVKKGKKLEQNINLKPGDVVVVP